MPAVQPSPERLLALQKELDQLEQHYFDAHCRELYSYGIHVGPTLRLLQGSHIMPYYDLQNGNIYLSQIDTTTPMGRLQLMFVRSLLSCDDTLEFFEFYRLMLPWMIGHELGHHLRQQYGLFGQNLWEEEQVANYLAFALTKHRLGTADRQKLVAYLRRATDGLTEKIQAEGKHSGATVSFGNVLQALQVSGQIDDGAVQNLEMFQKMFAKDGSTLLATSGQMSDEAVDQLYQRGDVIGAINQQYTSDVTRYLYYHLGWMLLGFSSREGYYLDEFARAYLGEALELLAPIKTDFIPNDAQIQACFRASQDAEKASPAAAHYFYKRYRSLLVARVQAAIQDKRLKDEAGYMLESWKVGDFDTLNYLGEIVPPNLRPLLPNAIGEAALALAGDSLERLLPSETDRRLLRALTSPGQDPAAEQTLARLEVLDNTDIYRVLSPEVALRIMRDLRRVLLQPGDILIKHGDLNNDVFILSEGKLAIHYSDTLSGTTNPTLATMINPGQVIGEVAFFTREPRNATVVALEASVCYALKASDLQIFAYNDPAILMQMAGALARRLNAVLKQGSARR